jgi:signal transduction histidine kinase/ActR/RegA family two-component response regulator
VENRLLIYTPTGKDGQLIERVLRRADLNCYRCANSIDVIEQLNMGAGALMIADEALTVEFLNMITPFVQNQKSWSDFPFLVLRREGRSTQHMRARYLQLENVVLLERPVRSDTLVNVAASALRARKRQYEMREIDQRKDEFLAMLAHELRNPLAPISAASDLLSIPTLEREKIRETSKIISRQVKHMTGLIDDLLDISRVSRGLVSLNEVTLDANLILNSAVEQVQPLITSRHHQLTIKQSTTPALVKGDKNRLIQVIANILNNAAKYTHTGGHILLTLEVDDAHVSFTIEDDGIGIEPHVLARVFDLFSQAERTSDRSQGGLGIGLALVRSIVNMHKGSVHADSSGLNKGSKFTVSLPRIFSATPVDAPRLSELNSIAAPKKILIVDDNVDAADMLGTYLEIAGYEVGIEHSAEAALKRSLTETPDAFLLDIGLPNMDGTVLARHLREIPHCASSLMIAITGYGQSSDKIKSFAAGFDHHLVKPVDMPHLVKILSSITQADGGRHIQ